GGRPHMLLPFASRKSLSVRPNQFVRPPCYSASGGARGPLEWSAFAARRRSGMPDDEKPKRTKSWREIDKMRDRGGPRRSDREAERFQQSTKYTQYKTNL